jgi:hypothetical protein
MKNNPEKISQLIEKLNVKVVNDNEIVSYQYDFYNENNIYIFNRSKPKIKFDFLIENYENIDNNIYNKYSLKNWIENIFNTSEFT